MEAPLFVWLIWNIMASGVVGYVAHAKARTHWGWFFCSFFLTPFFAALCLAALPRADKEQDDDGHDRSLTS